MDTLSIVEQMKTAKAELKAQCPFKKGDPLQWINDKGQTKKGRFDYVFVSDKLEVSIRINLPVTSHIGWSSSYEYFKSPDYSRFVKIEEPISLDSLQRIDRMDWRVDEEIRKATALLQKQKARLSRIRKTYQKQCLHEWQDLGGTGEVVRHLIGESEVHNYECPHCGMQIQTT